MSRETDFAVSIQEMATTLAKTADTMKNLTDTYFDRGFNGSLTNTALSSVVPSITAADVTSFITLSQQFDNFLNNAAVSQGDYDATLNKIRTDI